MERIILNLTLTLQSNGTPDEGGSVSPDAIPLVSDLLRGADKIAEFVFGDTALRRRAYHHATEVKEERRIPVFRLGNVLCARRFTLLRWIAEQEGRAQCA